MGIPDDIKSDDFKNFIETKIAEESDAVKTKYKVILVVLSWIAGLVIACPDPEGIGLIRLFPTGLFWLVSREIPLFLCMLIGWLVFGVLTVITLQMDRKRSFYTWLGILTLLLLLNGAGCNSVTF